MRYFRRAVAAAIVLGLVVGLGACWLYYDATRGPLPVTAGRLEIAGLGAPVEVLRDARGVPHIVAASAADLYFAQGYVTAQDRLWQMDLMRRDAAGELSEIFGEAAVDRDRAQRRLGLRRAAARALGTLEPEVRAALESYAAGVNALADAKRDDLPFEFQALRYGPRPWEPVDTLSIGKLMAQTLGSTYERDLMRASFADLDPEIYADLFVSRSAYDVPFVGSDQLVDVRRQTSVDGRLTSDVSELTSSDDWRLESEMLLGSNNWVVGGARTASGKPLLANDPHLALGLPPIWYAAHLKTRDGAVDVAGVTFPGAAGIVIGHNGQIAWGVTNFGPDVQDLYVERFDESGRRYRVGDVWEEATAITEVIRVRTGALGDVEEREVSFLETRHGPIVRDTGETKYALRWTALGDASEMPAFFHLNRARTWDEFRAALGRYPGPMQSFVYADTAGNIGYYAAGLVPVRASGTGDRPYDGTNGDGAWTGFIPFDRLPSAYNPEAGFVVTANNRIVGDSVPEFYTHEWIAPFRGRRITDRLAGATGLTAADMNAIQNDVYSYPDAVFARELARMAAPRASATGGDADEWREIAERFGSWDGMLSVESVPAAIVTATRRVFFERVMRAKLGERAKEYQWFGRDSLYTWMVEERPERWLPPDAGSWEALALESYRAAKGDLAARLGEDPAEWRYGRANTFTLAHPMGRLAGLSTLLNLDTFEVGGGPHAVKAIGVMRGWGPSMRLVVDLADVDRTTLVLPAGQSGHHASPHYADQTEAWRVGETFPFPFTDSAVRAATTGRLELVPR
jgi:penicillin amidase